MRPKPRLLIEMRREGKTDVYSHRQARVNLNRQDSPKPKKWIRPAFFVAAVLLGILSLDASVFAPIGGGVRALT
ncbi:MAG: hypothetical protein Q8P99_00620, partial [bacterium]|nr:hypothetical protein [bacterium]